MKLFWMLCRYMHPIFALLSLSWKLCYKYFTRNCVYSVLDNHCLEFQCLWSETFLALLKLSKSTVEKKSKCKYRIKHEKPNILHQNTYKQCKVKYNKGNSESEKL
jgi:hypothetical protein